MKEDLIVNPDVTIPEHELAITTSRAGGPGGQHVNKTNTKITIRWNVGKSTALTEEQKARIMHKLHTQITGEGDLVVHNSSSRSQQHNKKMALMSLANTIAKALHIPKKRRATKPSKAAQEGRLQAKTKRGELKKLRRTSFED